MLVALIGTMSDCQIFNESELKKRLDDDSINFPAPELLPHDDRDTPFLLLGNDALALRTYRMKPYSFRALTYEQRICNYRISRGRRVVENAFGILAMRFQVLLSDQRSSCCLNMPERWLRCDLQLQLDLLLPSWLPSWISWVELCHSPEA